MTLTETEAPRPLGRPRDPRLDEAITTATLELLAEGGYGALTIEAVATRAGVGKATLYRRWTGKEQLVVDAVRTLSEPPEPGRQADVRDEIVGLLEALRRKSTSSLAGRIFPRLIGEGADNPELMRRYREQVLEPRRDRFRATLRRGIDQGLIRPDADLDHVMDLLVGPMAYRTLIRTDPPPGPDLAARIVDDVLVALAPRPETAPRPAPQEDA
ncbi:MAG: transcriptional regulator, TetR family [Frankiales bacterium]|nr:transcriptional regulator, TetR family [Frankiales bacterium]